MPKAKEKKKEETKTKSEKKNSEMKTFKIYGTFKYSDGYQDFIKETKAAKEIRAIDKVYKLIGSQHRIKRKYIEIKKIEVS
ncbi:MAG: 50S ribosomal protein L18a [Candidatus Lokiarchaeota archaeon]|nr:50S ribosomal protein L18a [Candidatus Lokiarchaeota archaeon]